MRKAPSSREYWLTDPADAAVAGTGTSLRIRSLKETEALAAACLERCGITRIADVTELDVVGIPVFHSARPLAAPGLNTVTSGKGVTADAARVSAMMEAIERTWCELYDDRPVRASLESLRAEGIAVLDPQRLILRRDSEWTPQREIGWWPTRELASDAEVLVPALAVFTPHPHEHGMFSSNTIGLTVGNSPREALLHGLLELIEHDSSAFGETLRLGRTIPLKTVPDRVAELVERFARVGIEVQMFLYLTEIGVPTIHVTTEDTHVRDGMLFNGGVGCHLDPEIAAIRALTEAAQSRLNVIAGAREDFDRQAYRRHTSYAGLRAAYHSWSSGRDSIDFADIHHTSTATTEGDLDLVLAGLLRAGLTAVHAAELAPVDLPFSVTKVIVPGLEVFHEDSRRLGPRLRRARDV
jgi:ribosomal protein S12 methylthiotransferase accessory factor